jgi:hypothetical protein
MEPQIAQGLPWLGINSDGININNSSIPGDDDASLGDSPLSMLAAAATAAAAADAAASAAAAAAAAASAAVDASSVVSEAGLGGRAVEGMPMQQMVDQQQGGNASSGRLREGDSSVSSSDSGQGGAKNDSNSLLEPWAEKP